MKKFYILLIVNLSVCVNIHSQLNFLEKKGQFFEQGYGRNLDEEAMDLLQDGNNTVMCGWQTFFKTGNKNFTLWRINQYGKQLSEYNFADNWDNIATGIAKNTANTYILCGRSTPTYIPESIVEVGDSIKVLKVDTAGNIIWKFTYGRPDEGLAATDVFSTSGNDIYVIGNRKQLSNGRTSIFFLRLSANGQLHWIEYYNHRTNSITTHEMSPYNTNQYILSINQESGGGNIPMLLVFDHNANVVNVTAYTQFIKSNWYGIAKDGSNNIWLAGYEYQSADTNGWVVKLNNNLSVNFSLSTGTQGTEKYKDISLTPVGYICLGTATNQGEGGNDVYLVHYDHQNKVTLKETLGTAEHERANSLMLRNLPEPVAQFAGYCKGYGVAESGNAYLGATLYYEIGTLLNGQNCEVPRVIFLDNLIITRNSSGIIVRDILGDNTKENTFIDFCLNNNFNIVSIYNLGYVFDGLGNANDVNTTKNQLKAFVQKCRDNNLVVGYIADKDMTALLDVITNEIDHFNFSSYGKFNYIQLEHEFWNPFSEDYENSLFSQTNYLVDGTNDHFLELYNDHLYLLNEMVNAKNTQGNIWKVFDYVDKFWNGDVVNGVIHDFYSTNFRQDKTTEIANLVDAIFLTHYQTFDAVNEHYGKNFLFPYDNNDYLKATQFRTRLADLGNGNKRHIIIPLFSAEYYETSNDFCGEGVDTDFLGKFLNNYGDTVTFRFIEDIYAIQHGVCYNQISQFPNITNVDVGAMGWFKYSCVSDKNYDYDNDLIECNDFLINVGITELNSTEAPHFFIYPNPTNGMVYWDSDIVITKVEIIDIAGRILVQYQNIKNNKVELNSISNGVYFIRISNEFGFYTTQKLILKK